VKDLLTKAQHTVRHASSADALDREVSSGFIDVLVADRALFGSNWTEWLAAATRRWPDLPIVVVAQSVSDAQSIAALRAGAAAFVAKPFDTAELLLAVQNGVAAAEASGEAPSPASVIVLPSQPIEGTPMLGDSPAISEVQSLIRRAATSNATVLIRGESGAGKEVIARRIHELGPRSRAPFVKVHCAALPEALLESELFGHEKGAFTGANSRKPGRLEIADGGTLFLDEIGDITASTQVKLLRVLQDKQYERVGGTRTIQADVRFIAATHRPLEDMIRRGEFREDLYYRLNVIPIVAPPLRSRPDDIAMLVRHFCAAFGAQNGRPHIHVTPEAMTLLRVQPWPGNVRQLQNFIERLVVFAETDEIGFPTVHTELGSTVSAAVSTGNAPELNFAISVLELDEVVRRAERKALEKALQKAGGNRTIAARILGVSRRTLYNKLEEHGIA
jgi:two-component system, NtrC family, response regulator AtoC